MKTVSTIIISVLFFVFTSNAQESEADKSFVLSGKVINAENMEGISYAHINLGESYWGIICDSLGFFHIRVHEDQQLKISALGFKEQMVDITPPASSENEVFQEVYLERESYMLEQVNVYSLGTWADFTENFIKAKVPKDKNASIAMSFGNFKMDDLKGRTMRRQGFGLSIGMGKKKAKGVYIPSAMEELHDQILSRKFNAKLVAELTKESGERLEMLMKFINANSNFTHQTSDYYIGNKIKQLYNDFLQENPDWDINFTYSDSLEKVPNHLRP